MADSQLRTLIALGAFSPVGGGGGDIPEDLCVKTVKATTSITTPAGTITNLKSDSVVSCSVVTAAADIVSLSATGVEAETIYSPAGTVDSLTSTDIESGSIYAASGTIDDLSATTIAAGTVDATSVEADTLYSPSGTVDSLTSEDITTCSVIAGSVRTCSVQATSATVTGTSTLAQVTADILTVAGSASSPTVHTNSLYLSTGAGSEGELKYDTSQSALTWAGSPIGGGGDIDDLCVETLTATTSITTPAGTIDSLNVTSLEVGPDSLASITVTDGEFYTTTIDSSQILISDGNYTSLISPIEIDTTVIGISKHPGEVGMLQYDSVSDALTWDGKVILTESGELVGDLPYTPAGSICELENGKIYQIRTDCTASYPCYNFGGVQVQDNSTAEIWIQVGSVVPSSIVLPSAWKWVETPLPETYQANSHYAVTVRNVKKFNGHDAVTLANLAYSYETEE